VATGDAGMSSCVNTGELGPCNGTVMGSGYNQTFTCVNEFANGNATQTSFRLATNQVTDRVSISALDFLGAPAAGSTPTLVANDTINFLPGAGTMIFTANAGGAMPMGSITLHVDSVQMRSGGTPGDKCLHGKVDATLVLQNQTSSMAALHIDF
jgi:hypothetical protein